MILLLVEDDPDDVDVFCEVVQTLDKKIQITVSWDATKAIDLLTKEAFKPDLIFLDINLPIMTGIECLELLRNKHKINTPITIFSTTLSQSDKEACFRNHALSLIKPSSYSDWRNVLIDIIKPMELR